MKKILLGLLLLMPILVLGQVSNPVILTWQANNYFPADYAGRASVTPNTPVIASVELVQNGKLADLTKADIAWYVDGAVITRGVGTKTVSFSAQQTGAGYQTVRTTINVGNDSFDNSVQIPVNQPLVVVNVASPDKTAKVGSQIYLEAIPFFFNVSSLQELSFNWQINGQTTPNQNSSVSLNVGTPQSESQNSLPVSVTVQNSGNLYEFGRGFVNLSLTQ